MYVTYSRTAGFTLIELLVVIAIIGLLSSVILASLSTARQKSRDARRLADLNQIALALELYYDTNRAYPITSPFGWRSECAAWGGYAANDVVPGLVPNYMPSFPSDPAMSASGNLNCYLYISDGTDYKLLDYNIGDANPGAHPTLADPMRNIGQSWSVNPCPGAVEGTWTWAKYSSGARCAPW